jgi:ABC-type nitrate/sulfonate/bicarbonate transport system ATPase subunit
LARALAPEPSVLLLDEPFAALDAFTKVQLQEELLRIARKRRTTCVLVTHDIEEAVFLSERVVVMTERPGTIAQVFEIELAHPRERTSPEFSELRRRILLEFKRQAPTSAAGRIPLSLATESLAPTTDPPIGQGV